MPVDAKDAMLTAGLSSPTPPPPQPGSNFQAISGVNPSMNYGMPFGTGTTVANSGATQAVNTFDPVSGGFQGVTPGTTLSRDINEVGGNVAGLYGRDYSPEDTKAFIPEAKDPLEEQTNEFIDAYDEGYEVQDGTIDAFGNVVEGDFDRKGEAGTMRAARLAKREDRYQDREARREAEDKMYNDLVAGGMKKGKARREARRMKREMRKGARASRKAAWKTFKGERELRQQEEALKLEQKYS